LGLEFLTEAVTKGENKRLSKPIQAKTLALIIPFDDMGFPLLVWFGRVMQKVPFLELGTKSLCL